MPNERNMPPRQKNHRSSSKNLLQSCKNPRVILRPLLADQPGHGRYRFNSLPGSASLYNKPELSDIKLHVGDNTYFAHKLILCASSDVFKHMLDERWSDAKKQELVLEEEEECVKHFERFLQYLYTGSIIISESYVIALFLLADKYNVHPLYLECVKIIENGLKVYIFRKKNSDRQTETPSPTKFMGNSSVSTNSSSSSESSDNDFSESENSNILPQSHMLASASSHSNIQMVAGPSTFNPPTDGSNTLYLVASETFALTMVVKMLMFCHNERIQQAALYNLEARLSKQISNGNYGVWNDIDQSLLKLMLKDTYFYVKEYAVFLAVKAWLQYSSCRQKAEILSEMLCLVRYPMLSASELYCVERDDQVRSCPSALELVNEAIRYQLFRDCCSTDDQARWKGELYRPRMVKDEV